MRPARCSQRSGSVNPQLHAGAHAVAIVVPFTLLDQGCCCPRYFHRDRPGSSSVATRRTGTPAAVSQVRLVPDHLVVVGNPPTANLHSRIGPLAQDLELPAAVRKSPYSWCSKTGFAMRSFSVPPTMALSCTRKILASPSHPSSDLPSNKDTNPFSSETCSAPLHNQRGLSPRRSRRTRKPVCASFANSSQASRNTPHTAYRAETQPFREAGERATSRGRRSVTNSCSQGRNRSRRHVILGACTENIFGSAMAVPIWVSFEPI